MGLADELAGRFAPGVELLRGQITAVDAATGEVTVNIDGLDHTDGIFFTGGYSPHVGDGVAVLRNGQELLCIGGKTRPLPSVGEVVSVPVGSPTIVVSAGGSTYDLPFESTYTPAVSDQVYLLWPGTERSGLVTSKVGTTPAPLPPPPPPPPPPSGGGSGVTTFPATHVGTWRSGWRNDDNGDVIQGVAPGFAGDNEGAWFYSGAPSGTLAGATVTGAEIYLGRTSGGVFAGQACHMYRVTDNNRPAGALTFGTGPNDATLAVGQEGWFGLNPSLVQELVNSGGSIGIKGSPYMRMYGLSKHGSAGALRIYWRR